MAQETVTVGDTEVQITETDDGFEVTEVEDDPDPGSPEKFTEDTGFSKGDSLSTGYIEDIKSILGDRVRVCVSDETWDVVRRDFIAAVEDSPWEMDKIEFEDGYMQAVDTDA